MLFLIYAYCDRSLFIFVRKTPQKILLAHIKAKPKQVFCGPDTSAVLFENGDMYVCGSNDHNKLGFEKISRIMALVCIMRK